MAVGEKVPLPIRQLLPREQPILDDPWGSDALDAKLFYQATAISDYHAIRYTDDREMRQGILHGLQQLRSPQPFRRRDPRERGKRQS